MLAEARRLGVAIVLVTGQGDHRFAALADVALALPRAAAGRAALRAEFDPPRRGRTEGSHSG